MESESEMNDIVKRWRRAAERAEVEQVRVIEVDGTYRATSSSTPLMSYRLQWTDRGWACECIANRTHALPCKHLAALANVLDLDVIADMRVELPGSSSVAGVAA
jgi:hypothetical protein